MESSLLSEMHAFSHYWSRHAYALPSHAIERGFRFLTTSSNVLRQRYSRHHLTKILNAFCSFEEKLASHSAQKRNVFFRLFKIHKSENSLLGIAIVLTTDFETERLTISQLFKAISHQLSGVVEVPEASYSYKDEEKGLLFIYVEIEKKRGRGFSPLDLKQLRTSFTKELLESIQPLTPSLFIIRNEEEIFRNIVQMSRELKKIHDIPQVAVSFQEQSPKGFLRFSVVIVRLVTSCSPPLKTLSARLPKTLRWIPEMTAEIGHLDPTHIKQANLMTFEVESALFSRKNGSIDLREARAYVAKGIELMIGEYRDYNGGLLSNQNKQLKEIKEMLEDSNKRLIESLFYSFIPSVFQSFLLPEAGKACASLVIKAKSITLTRVKPYALLEASGENFSLIVVKTSEEQLKNRIQKEMSSFSFPLHQFGYVVQNIDSEYILALVHQYPKNLLWRDSIKKTLQHAHDPIQQEKKLLRLNFQDGDPGTLNPHTGLDLKCRALQKALFEGLMRSGPDGKIELAAAQSFDISNSGKTYTFTLKSLQWSNGEELTAFHFEKTWRRAIQSPSCLRPDLFFILKNVRNAHFGKAALSEIGVKALDKRTLQVKLEYPAPYFLQMLAHPLFFPLYEDHGEPFVFSGPFTLHTWTRDRSLILIKNPYYWDFDQVKLDGIEISILRDPHLAFEKYQKKELNWIGGPFSLLPPSITAKTKQDLKRVDTPGIAWLYCNLSQPLFASAKTRRALSYSLDRKRICQKTFHYPIPCETHIPTGLSHLQPNQGTGENVFALFEEGLEEIGCSRKSLSPLRLFHSHIPGQKEMAIEIQQQWQDKFCIEIERIEATWNLFSRQLDNRSFHFGSCYRHPFYHDPMYFFNIFYEPTNVHNAFGWHSELFNHWVNQARAHPEETQYLKKAEEELQLQMPVIPIHLVTYHYLAQEGVQGIHFCHSGDVDFRWIYIDKR